MSASATRATSAPSRAAWPGWAGAAAVVVALFFALGLLTEAFAPSPRGPPGSAYATTPDGVAAWASLLERDGHPVVRLRNSLGSVSLPAQVTLVLLDAGRLGPGSGRRIDRFLEAGGRLVVGGGDPDATAAALGLHAPPLIEPGASTAHPAAATPEVRGLHTVLTAAEAAWGAGAGATALTTSRGALLLVRHVGLGTVDLLADPSPLENRLLATDDNAQLSLNLAGGARRPVVFAEAVHGFGVATGLAAIPTAGWVTFAGLSLALIVWAFARGRRIGPPERPDAGTQPPRSAYVDALAATLVRTKDLATLKRLASSDDSERRSR